MSCRLSALMLAYLLAGCAGTAPPDQWTRTTGYPPPLAENMARLTVVRSDETLLVPQRAQLSANGQLMAEMAAGEQRIADLRPGLYFFTVRQRQGAPAAAVLLTALAGHAYRLQISLDADRFPAYDGPLRPLEFIRQSLNAPRDDRQALYQLKLMTAPGQGAPRSSARQSQAELERAIADLPAPLPAN